MGAQSKGNKYNRTETWLQQHDYTQNGKYTGNINTLIYHDPCCFETIKMKKEHKITTDNTMGLYRACKRCKPYLKEFQKTLENTVESIA